MPKYRITCEVKEVRGQATYLVTAKSKAHALKAYLAGGGELEEEQVEVVNVQESGMDDVEIAR